MKRMLVTGVLALCLAAGAASAQQSGGSMQPSPNAGSPSEAGAAGTDMQGAFLKTMEEMIGATVHGADGNALGTVSDVIYDPAAQRAERIIVETPDGRRVALDHDDARLELDQDLVVMESTTQDDLAGIEDYTGGQGEGRSLKEAGG